MVITYKNGAGKSASFAYDIAHDFVLEGFDAYDLPVKPITFTGYNQNGSTYIHSNVGNRKITLNFIIYGDAYNKIAAASTLFNPTAGLGTLTISNNNKTRYIDCYVSGAVKENGSQDRLKKMSVTLEAPIPYFYGEEKSVTFDTTQYSGLQFPLVFDSFIAMDHDGMRQTILNEGDVASPVKLTVNNCYVVNPTFTCSTTNEHIGIIGTLKRTDKMIINTGYGEKGIYVNGINKTNLFEPSSTWLELPVGRSTWLFEADSANPVLTLTWREYYNIF